MSLGEVSFQGDPQSKGLGSKLVEHFLRLHTKPGDLVLDPFAGSNVTGEAAERLSRRWIAVELIPEYLEGSRFRFPELFVAREASRYRASGRGGDRSILRPRRRTKRRS